MTDVTVADTGTTEPEADRVLSIQLKGDCGTVEVDVSKLSMEVYKAMLIAGLEATINKIGMSKLLPGVTKLEGEERTKRTAEVQAQAAKNVEALYEGNLKGGKAKKASGAVQTEAMRLAKNMVKDLIRSSGQKIGAYSAKEQTAAAKVILERNPHLIQLAEKNLSERVAEAKGTKALDLKGLFGAKAESEDVKAKPKVAPTRKKKDGEKPTLSAAQAGKVAPRHKPAGATAH